MTAPVSMRRRICDAVAGVRRCRMRHAAGENGALQAAGQPVELCARIEKRDCGPMLPVNADRAAALASDRDDWPRQTRNRAGRWTTSLANCSIGSTPRDRTSRSSAFEALSQDIEPLLRLLFILAVLFYGVQLLLGTSRISVAEVIGRLARVLVIFILVGTWANFNSLVYEWLTDVPEAAGPRHPCGVGDGRDRADQRAFADLEDRQCRGRCLFGTGRLFLRPSGTDRHDHHGVCRPVRRDRARDSRAREGHALGAAGHRAHLHLPACSSTSTRNYAMGWINQSCSTR